MCKKLVVNKRKSLFFLLFIVIFLFLLSSKFQNLESSPIIYAEQYYLLYVDGMTDNQIVIFRNIEYLQKALEAPFAPVVQALTKITSQEQYIRYKFLFKMHINLLIVKCYLQLGARFDKENIYFYNYLYKEMIIESLQYAKYFYSCVPYYYDEAKKFQKEAERFQKWRIDIDLWEDEYYKLKNNKMTDYNKIAMERIKRIDSYIEYLKSWPNQFYPENK
ncbi:MAG: hypothetical protein N3A58_02835 [Spirochaetes bacterium]|nr:hypothetical protein [Spirochaetota bacterium]